MPLTVLGLGPGAPELLTLEARQALGEASELWLRTARHPVVPSLPPHLTPHSFDALYDELPTFEAVYEAIVDRVWELSLRPEGVLYAVPGHPLVAEATVLELLRRSRGQGMPVRVIAGLSFIEPALTALELDPFFPTATRERPPVMLREQGLEGGGTGGPKHPSTELRTAPTELRTRLEEGFGAPFPGLPGPPVGLQLVDALQPQLDPSRPALVGQLYNQSVAAQLKLELLELYPVQHGVTLISGAGTPEQRVTRLPLFGLDRGQPIDHLTCLYLPALDLTQNVATFDGLAAIIARLRAPGGCPWDREQTHASLKPYLIEEAYEALDALEREDMEGLQQELGDLLLNIVLHAQLAAEAGEFEVRDVVRGIAEKLLRRHPHVFGEAQADTPQQVVANWETLKAKERGKEASMLSGLARSLPALAYTRSVQQRLAPLGLGGPPVPSPLLGEGQGEGRATAALGDELFRIAFDAARAGLDPEEALRSANRAFTERVERAEELARAEGSTLRELPQERRLALWRRAGVD